MPVKWMIPVFAVTFILEEAKAQFTLPRIDIEVKLAQNVVSGSTGNKQTYPLQALETTDLHLGAHWQINQHIAVGWIYSGSLRGSGYNAQNFNFSFGQGDSKAVTSFSGLDLRLSAGRAVTWRPYMSLSYGKAEVVEDKGSFRLADKTTSVGGSIGIMRRFGHHLYWNVFEAGLRQFSSKLFWADDGNFIITFRTGFTYNIGKKR